MSHQVPRSKPRTWHASSSLTVPPGHPGPKQPCWEPQSTARGAVVFLPHRAQCSYLGSCHQLCGAGCNLMGTDHQLLEFPFPLNHQVSSIAARGQRRARASLGPALSYPLTLLTSCPLGTAKTLLPSTGCHLHHDSCSPAHSLGGRDETFRPAGILGIKLLG